MANFFHENKTALAGFAAGIGASLVLSHIWTPPWCRAAHERYLEARESKVLPEVVGYRTVHKNDHPSPNHSFKLIYFNVKGLAEPARMIFAAAGNKEYEDFRYPYDLKTSAKPEFDADAAAGKFNHTLGQVPVLEVDGKLSFGQSKAIERYLARQFGFWGESEAEGALVDSVCEHVRDLRDAYRKVWMNADEKEKATATRTFVEKELPEWLKAIEGSLSGANGYSVGAATSLADILLFQLFLDVLPPEATSVLQAHKKLAAIHGRIAGCSRIQDWIKRRPFTER
jgi:glutathione S-transferase